MLFFYKILKIFSFLLICFFIYFFSFFNENMIIYIENINFLNQILLYIFGNETIYFKSLNFFFQTNLNIINCLAFGIHFQNIQYFYYLYHSLYYVYLINKIDLISFFFQF